jgi:hypothetical protein
MQGSSARAHEVLLQVYLSLIVDAASSWLTSLPAFWVRSSCFNLIDFVEIVEGVSFKAGEVWVCFVWRACAWRRRFFWLHSGWGMLKGSEHNSGSDSTDTSKVITTSETATSMAVCLVYPTGWMRGG